MHDARALAILEIEAHGDDPRVRLVTASREWGFPVAAEALCERTRVIDEIERLEHEEQTTSFPAGSTGARTGRATLALGRSWSRLAEIDFAAFLAPLLACLHEPTFVAYAVGDLRGFSPRASLRWGVRHGRVDALRMLALSSIPLWSPHALPGLLRHWPNAAPPVVDPRRLHFMFGRFDFMAPVELELSGDPAVQAALARSPAFHELRRERSLLQAWRAAAQRMAEGLAATVTPHATRSDFLRAITGPTPGACLVLFAHQDEVAVHLADGPLTHADLAAGLLAASPPASRHACVEFAVCRAAYPHDLAGRVQDLGYPVVLCRLSRAQLASTLFTWLEILALLQAGARLSLPALHDLAWLRLNGHAPA